MLQLLDLPPEIVVQALCYLDLPDLASVSQTNSSLRFFTQTFQILQYRFATQAAGVDDNPHCNLVVAERLAQLRSREEGWSKFQFDFRRTIPVQHAPSGIYDMTGGIYLLGDASRRALHYCKLPSKPGDPVRWFRIAVDSTLVDMGLAIYEHDLIAIVTTTAHKDHLGMNVIEVVLLQFSTGKPHPLARSPILFVAESQWPRPSIGIEIVGDHLALVTNYFMNQDDPEDHFYIFEWKTGARKMAIPAGQHTYSSLVFLSPNLVLLPNTRETTLDIWAIPASPTPAPTPNTSTTTTTSPPAPTHPFLSLGLPSVSSGQLIITLSCRGEPNPSSSGTPHAPSQPFTATPEDALVIFNLRVLHPALALGSAFSMFTLRSILLALAVHVREQQSQDTDRDRERHQEEPDGQGMYLPWYVWGPPFTRWFDADDMPTRWITTSAGQRSVICSKEVEADGDMKLTVLDFNPLTVRRVLAEGAGEGARMEVVTEPSRIEHEAFEEPLEGSLPYVSLTYPVQREGAKFDFAGVLMDEERLLGLRTDEYDKIVEIEVMHMGAAPAI